MDTEETIQQAKEYLREGDKTEARRLLSTLVKGDPENKVAWWLLSWAVDEKEQAIYCLEKMLAIDPVNQQAIKRMNELKGVKETPAASAPTQQPQQIVIKERIKRNPLVTILAAIGAIVLICICGSFLYALGTQDTTSEKPSVEQPITEKTQPLPEPTMPSPTEVKEILPTTSIEPEIITLWCPDCAEEEILINIWEKPGPLGTGPITCMVPHGTQASRIGVTSIEGFEYSNVSVLGHCDGWLRSTLFQPGVVPTETAPVQTFYGVGDVVQLEDHTITLTEANFIGNIIKTKFKIQNTGNEQLSLSSLLSFDARGQDGTRLEIEIFECGPSLSGDIVPGDQLAGELCWIGATPPVKIYYSPVLFGSTTIVWQVP